MSAGGLARRRAAREPPQTGGSQLARGLRQGTRPMAEYHARDLVRVPGLLSLLRLPLAMAFARATDPRAACAIVLAAGATDVLDGWYARRFDQVSAAGAAIDPITDKVFIASVIARLVARGRLTLGEVALLGLRELGELPLAVWSATSPNARAVRAARVSANLAGKLATALQFASVSAALFGARVTRALAAATAVAGGVAAALYWRRVLRLAGRCPRPPGLSSRPTCSIVTTDRRRGPTGAHDAGTDPTPLPA